ncbi:MAG: glycosyltransferase family 39 protein [Candidatus Kerfeldbacteria bacterium]|nr:glycosyltransferase family 39 protein [Candidatus Kerfeldbacteria bacterium]
MGDRPDKWALVFGCLIVGFFWLIGGGKELWFDERFVQVVASQSFPDMFGLLKFENNPPLTFLVTKIWMGMVGSSPLALRASTLLPTLATLVVVQQLVRSMAGRRVASLAVILTAVSGQVIIQSQELRMYPWVMLWSAIALLIAWQLIHGGRAALVVWLVAVYILGLYTHYTFGFMVAATAAWVMFQRRDLWKTVAIGLIVTGLCFAPWLWYSVWAKLTDLSANVGIQRIAASRPAALLLPFQFIIPPPLQDHFGWLIVRLAGGVGIVVGLVGFIARVRDRAQFGRRLLLATSLVALVGLVGAGIVVAKYASILIVPIVIMVAWGLIDLPFSNRIRLVVVGVLIGAAGLLSWQQARMPYVTYAAAADIVEQAERPGDVVLVYPFNDTIAVKPEYQGNLPVRGFFPLKSPAEVGLPDIIRYNFRVTLTPDNIGRLSDYVDGAARVWFFFDVPPSAGYWHGDLIAEWFRSHGYTATRYTEIFRRVPPLLIRYDLNQP